LADAQTNDSKTSSEESPLYGALDRFAQFFIAPLFLESTLDRELQAVNSENKKNLQNDTWRLHQLNKSLSNPKHPYCHFSTGSLDTLRDKPRARGVEIREKFMEFHDKHYSANLMKLVVLGKESLDELEDWVSELFAPCVNKNLASPRWEGEQPLTNKELMTQYFAKPVKDFRTLTLQFPFLDETELYESQPHRYIDHLIGHEGPGSILSYIKAKGWANSLGAGPSPVCPGTEFLTIQVSLTSEGLKHYQDIVAVIFQYIAMIKEKPPQEWIVEELKGIAAVEFKYQQKSRASSFTSKVSSVMQKPLPRKFLLSGSRLIRKFDPEVITEALGYLRPDNFRISVVSQTFPGKWDQQEKWYGTEYFVEKIPSSFMNEIKKAAASTSKDRLPELHFPHKNEFIPTKLDVEKKEVKTPTVAPKLIRNDQGVRIWWKKDDTFWVPKANVLFTLRTPLLRTSPASMVKASLYVELVKDALTEYSYDAECAGLDYSIVCHAIGIDIELSGYNDKMHVLLEKVLVYMRDLEVKSDRFDVIKERLARGYRNWEYSEPYQQVGDFTRWLSSESGAINEEYLSELEHITVEDVKEFYPQLLRQNHIEALVHGNIYKEDAFKLVNLLEATLKPRVLPERQWHIRRSLLLPEGSDFTYKRTLKDPANVNHCIEYYLYVGDKADRPTRARLLMLAQMTDEPAFNQLRTTEQLGYVVWSSYRVFATTLGYRVLIQSERQPSYLEERIEAFLKGFGTVLQEMDDEEFEGHKRSLVNKRLEKVKDLTQESNRMWSAIGSEYFDFEQGKSTADIMT
jgi:insulysin